MKNGIPYYLERKNYLDQIRRTKDNRALEVLSNDMALSVSELYRQDFKEPVAEDSTFEERLEKYIKELDNGGTKGIAESST